MKAPRVYTLFLWLLVSLLSPSHVYGLSLDLLDLLTESNTIATQNLSSPKESGYVRKSIASPEQIMTLSDMPEFFKPKQAKLILDRYVQLKRFDKNTLPTILTKQFIKAINRTPSVNSKSIESLIQTHYGKTIKNLLEDPAVQEAKINQFKKKTAFSFEFSKGRSHSVTADDLKTLFHSSYFYVPYIEQFTIDKSIKVVSNDDHYEKDKDKKKVKFFNATLSGGIYWYQIIIHPDNSIEVLLISHIQKELSNNLEADLYVSEPVIRSELINETLTLWSHNLGHQAKFISHFKLFGTIMDQNNYNYSLSVFNTEDVSQDDYYWLMEDQIENNKLVSKRRGLLFIDTVGIKTDKTLEYSVGRQVYGSKDTLSSWVQEAPLHGITIGLSGDMKQNFIIDPNDAIVKGIPLFNTPIKYGFGISALGSIKMPGLSEQSFFSPLYLDIDGSFNFVPSEYTTDGTPYLYNYFIGIRKKYWFLKYCINGFAKIGTQVFKIDEGTNLDYFQMQNAAIKWGFSVEKMIGPFWLMNLSLYRTLTLGDPYVSYVTDISEDSYNATDSRLNMIGISLGFKWLK